MDTHFFLNSGMHFDQPAMATWHSLTPMVSSPVSNESFVIRELIGNICNSPGETRKRKSLPNPKCTSQNQSNAKRAKFNQEITDGKTEQSLEEEEEEEAPHPPKDYIHVRARRGQATDSHSLAERLRREKISERMKLLQDLVPGCNKVTGKALMLEEIINYVQSLQGQVEFLSMKLASVNPRLDFNTHSHFQEDAFSTYPLDNLASTLYASHQQNGITGSGMGPPCLNPMDPINQSNDLQLPTINGFNNGVPELCEGDLHTIVQMGFAQNTNLVQDRTFEPRLLQGSNQSPALKSEF